MKTLILTGGEWPCDERVQSLVYGCDSVLCCDGAAGHARRLGIQPDVLIGDMDSIMEHDRAYMSDMGVQEICLPSEKDQTDTQAACRLAIRQGANDAIIIGGLGNRTDHSLGNIHCLWMLHDAGVAARICAGDEEARIITDTCSLGRYVTRTFSLIPLLPDTVVFSMTGVKYPLDRVPLMFGSTLGISNIVLSDRAQLTVHPGAALLIINLAEV